VLLEVGGLGGGMVAIKLPLIVCHALVPLNGLSDLNPLPNNADAIRIGSEDEFAVPANAGEQNQAEGVRLMNGDSFVCSD
jgi:hypothetical protein